MPWRKTGRQLRRQFESEYLKNGEEQKYKSEFNFEEIYEYPQFSPDKGISDESLKLIYTIIRKEKPKIVVETGVCNGFSTGVILYALEKNQKGRLYSIDYPFHSDDSIDEFKSETFSGYGGASIPADKNPGWVVKDQLKERWEYKEGKSQKILPELVNELEKIDIFMHDSEHSHPAMMFEYEIVWPLLTNMLISDDISWNQAFDIFSEVRVPEKKMKLNKKIGVLLK